MIIKVIRKRKGITQKELAIRSGLSIATIKKLEQGKLSIRNCKLDTLYKISISLGVEITDIIG